MTWRRVFLVVALSALIFVTTAGSSSADITTPVTTSGPCSPLGSGRWGLTVGRYDATHLRVRFVISRVPSGSAWQVFGSDNGHTIFSVAKLATTDGVVRVVRVIFDRSGSDLIKASGYSAVPGITCSGSATF